MKKQILMLSAVAMIMVASCSKSKDEPKEETVNCQLTEKNYSNLKIIYTYHSDGKLASVKEGDYQETYTYTANTMVWKFIDGGTATTTYTLDAQGLVKSSSEVRSNSTFSYNSDGYLTEVNSSGSLSGKVIYTWISGNLTKVEKTTVYGTTTINIEYNTEN
ncbi:MAG: DUF4595 domain-containing protein, partial [Pedobacter sp.]